jgi:hypothetical protein
MTRTSRFVAAGIAVLVASAFAPSIASASSGGYHGGGYHGSGGWNYTAVNPAKVCYQCRLLNPPAPSFPISYGSGGGGGGSSAGHKIKASR